MALLTKVRSHSVSTGAFVVREGERADSLFFVREGQVDTSLLTTDCLLLTAYY